MAQQPSPPDGAAFEAVLELNQTPAAMEPKLRQGQEVKSKDWPAIYFLTYKVDGHTFGCGGAIVGPQVLLTAAHCVPTTGLMKLTMAGAADQDVTCTRHPAYAAQDPSADFALCRLPPGLFAAKPFPFEMVSIAPADQIIAKHVKLLLGGFGCTSESAAEGTIAMRPDAHGVMRPIYLMGLTNADQASFSKPPNPTWGLDHYVPHEHATIITKADGPNLCAGDSGGPAFVLSPTYGADMRPRAIVAVNSRVLTSGPLLGPSLLSVTGGFSAAPPPPTVLSFAAWATDWSKGLTICGVVGEASICPVQ